MDKNKEKDLLNTYKLWINSFMEDATLIDQLDDLVSPDIMGYGTTVEERIFNINKLKELCLLGHEQKQFLKDYNYNLDIVKKQYSSTNESAVIVAEINVSYSYNEVKVVLQLRISTVLFYENGKWKIVHWHGSAPVETEEGDTWHADEWKKENDRLQKKVDEQTKELKQTIENLKATQAQLIQSEKMASLGELTAGIAHEIQNPLNFVNNFAEVSNELIDEMNEELDNGDIEEAKAISIDIKQNLEKINHHGKRADGIVKGMLQHSRSSSGKKESTDINALIDEYFRLAYHGLRAKDKSFNATLITDFDKTIDKVSVIPQDIGRVILNLITNAFYACNERNRNMVDEKTKSGVENYEPTVTVSTKKGDSTIEIKVIDNGNGIPEPILNKIFEPFFTTKPTGKGTGLGLSMSYDIVTKGHGGELKVNTQKEIGTTFTITLPN
jgi:signal transduction histidine kinase